MIPDLLTDDEPLTQFRFRQLSGAGSEMGFVGSFPIKGSDDMLLIECPETWRHHSLILRIRSDGDISDDTALVVLGITKSELLLPHQPLWRSFLVLPLCVPRADVDRHAP